MYCLLVRHYTKLNSGDNFVLPTIKCHQLMIDSANRIVLINEKTVDLTGKEFDLLYFLAAHKGRIFTKKQLYNHIWHDDNNIMSFISKLRKKIEPDANHPLYIQIVRGVGYRFNQAVYNEPMI